MADARDLAHVPRQRPAGGRSGRLMKERPVRVGPGVDNGHAAIALVDVRRGRFVLAAASALCLGKRSG